MRELTEEETLAVHGGDSQLLRTALLAQSDWLRAVPVTAALAPQLSAQQDQPVHR
jgi:hypothetical protein